MNNFLSRPLAIVLLLLIAAIAAGYFYFFRKEAKLPEIISAKIGTIVREVNVTGEVKSAQKIELSFEQSGKVRRVNAETGTAVEAGSVLVELDSAELIAQLNEAKAGIEAQKAELEKLKKGAKTEEIKVKETKVLNAKISLEDAKKNLNDKLNDAYVKSDDSIRNKTDQFFSNPRSASPQIHQYLFVEQALKIDIEQGRIEIENILNNWKSSLDNLILAKNNLEKIKLFLDKTALAVNNASANANLSQTTLDSWKSAVFTARTNINEAISGITAADEKLRSAESALALAEDELTLVKTAATTEEILAKEAQTKQAEAKAETIRIKIGKNFLRSPIDGIIARLEPKTGEIVSTNQVVALVISKNDFEIEAKVPEADIAKIKIGDRAKITLDAFGGETIFEAEIIKIEPAETIVEGVATYKTTLRFIKEDKGIRPGMTANIDILIAKKENALFVPQRALILKISEEFVRILNADNSVSEKKIKTGLRGSDGNIEIIEGLREGEKVIVSQ